ncbi:DUF1024 family protein [Staphylococcus aureus]|nr:DUF1024 family protein [Staphylococcus aureus]
MNNREQIEQSVISASAYNVVCQQFFRQFSCVDF